MRCAGRRSMRSPRNVISPCTDFNSSDIPDTVLRLVDFPAPLLPIIATTSPSYTSRSMPVSARTAPYWTASCRTDRKVAGASSLTSASSGTTEVSGRVRVTGSV